MINGITLKICGITSVNDAVTAAGVGADYLGFIFHAASPRHVSESKYQRMASVLPATKRVAVVVEPAVEDLGRLLALGFEAFQIHFASATPDQAISAWREAVQPRQLWLAPRLPEGEDVKASWIEAADALVLDTFHADKAGGTGQIGDWPKFKLHAQSHPEKTWILAGGLGPDNIASAVSATDALFIDVNSGVEESPGVKSQEKLFALWRALERL
jgi:phosphoribosylanthranilate isomerase